MRQPASDPNFPNLTERGLWLQHLNGYNERLREHAQEELDKQPPIPEELRYLYRWWFELDIGRRYGMNGAEPIGYADIEVWSRLRDHQPSPVEVSALLLIDQNVREPGKRES